MQKLTEEDGRDYLGLLDGLGIVRDKRLLLYHFTEDRETMDAVIAELRKLKEQPTPKEAEQLILGVIMKQHYKGE